MRRKGGEGLRGGCDLRGERSSAMAAEAAK